MICYHARWVVPVTAAPIEDGTVACADGIIRYVGPRTGAPSGTPYELGDAILLPGLVNAHTHLELTAMRGFLEALSFPMWIDTLRRSRNEVLTDDHLLDSARLGVLEGLHRGITTYADTCSSGVSLRAMRELGVRGIMYQEVFGPDPKVCDAAIADLSRRIDQLRPDTTDLVTLGVSPHAPYTVSDDLYRATANYARDQQLPMAMHIAESIEEETLVNTGTGDFADRLRRRDIPVAPRARSPIALLDQLGCLNDHPLLIHTVRVDPDDISTIVRSKSTIAHCPASNAKFGHGIAPLADFLAANIPVGLGSDSVASNNRMDILDEARLAALFQTVRTNTPLAISAQTALELATIRGAQALHLADRVGSLDPGKSADLSAFPLSTPRTIPSEDPIATAIYALSGTPATFVAVAGDHLIEDGYPVAHPGALHDRVTFLGKALAAWKVPV
ncbi:MAG TPA: amidohydrolase family protein [Gemmatimonadaceae bacterium]|jgi:cytosine/adenosine deaminase-related metal-dependent hydrolase|nr:amidohydrolase family protein [Gemmatimonadaceae bacterium]